MQLGCYRDSMLERAPKIADFMTTLPASVPADSSLAEVARIMKAKSFHHLPIVEQGHIIGVIRDHDLTVALNILGQNGAMTPVRQITMEEVYLVRPDSNLDEVIDTMTKFDLSNVLVIHHHRLVGIFTISDAIRALKTLRVALT